MKWIIYKRFQVILVFFLIVQMFKIQSRAADYNLNILNFILNTRDAFKEMDLRGQIW